MNNGAFLNHTKIKVKGSGNKIVLSSKCYLDHCLIQIYGNDNIIFLDEQVVIHKGSLYMEDNEGSITIGKKSLICGPSQITTIEGKRVEIGKDSLFSSETVIRTGDSHSVLDISGKRINQSCDVVLGEHVWVGYRTMLLKGAYVSSNTVIASGAVVTHRFEEQGIVIAGSPAKKVKGEINWSLERL